MKRIILVGFACVLFVFGAMSHSRDSGLLKIKGFYLGMDKIWKYSDETQKFSISIDDYKKITLKVL
jgi:hypothetical protein